MSKFSVARREIATLLKHLRKIIPPFTKLPHVVMAADWSGEDGRPADGEWAKMEQGELGTYDAPGHEEQNRAARKLAHEHGMQPKMYMFDPDAEFGVDP
jgi:hypothetical protein